ncbi:arginine/agmatine antiporter [Escherichia coli]|uniref:Arginine/agmatine antiporter n=1 Tax=Escherichia coli TaxID=562 RepID=A0A377DYY9_ECOLX|nr:arginine/agmatine antiporter [Escherichia coli]
MVGDDYRCTGALDGIRQNVVPRPKSWWFLRLRPPLLWPVSRLSNQRPLLAGLLDRQYRHGGHWRRIFSYFFPILKDPLVLTITCVVVLWIFVLLNIVGPKMITRVQAVATVLAADPPSSGLPVFGWFWFRGETYMAAWNVSGLGTFGAIPKYP